MLRRSVLQQEAPPRAVRRIARDALARPRQAVLLSRDLIRLFGTLQVADSFLLQNNVRELLFRKPA